MMNTNQIDFDSFLPVLAKVSELPPTGTKEDLPTKEMMNTNQIDFDSFLPVLAKVSELPPTGTKEDFLEGMKVFDKEGNGYVLAVEIQHVLGSLGESLRQDEVEEIFKGVEVNSNGAM